MSKVSKEDALKYHSEGKAGKIEVIKCLRSVDRKDCNFVFNV